MKPFLSLLLIAAIGLQAVSQEQDEVVRVRSNEVRLDVVVKDKKGRPIRDLKPSDFEVLEDGVPQKVESFRFVSRETAPANSESKDGKSPDGPSTATPTAPARRTSPSVTALVFDRLSPEARSLARKAGLAYAQEGMVNGDFTGVFRIDQSLVTEQSFTDDVALVKEAVAHATSAAGSTYASGAQRNRDIADQSAGMDREIDTATSTASTAGASQDSAGAAAAGNAAGQAAAAQEFLQLEANMIQQY